MGINQRLYMIMQTPLLVSRSNISLDPIAGLLKRCLKFKALRGGRQVHAWLVTRGTDSRILSLNSKLVGMYASCGDLKSATLVFKRIRNPNVFALNWMVLASAFEGYYKEAIWFFCSMKDSVFIYNKYTFSVVLKAFVGLLDLNKGKEVHCMVKQLGFESDVCVANALVDMYSKCGCIGYARRVFDRMVKRDIVSWTSMISGYCNVKKIEEALALFERMRLEGLEPNDFTWNVLISGYARRGDSDGAFSLLSKMTREGLVPDLVTWNAMIAGFVQGERAGDAFKLFQDIRYLAEKIIDDVTRGDLKKPGSFAMLSAIYATIGEGKEARYNTKEIVEERKAQKEPAFSQVEEKDKLVGVEIEKENNEVGINASIFSSAI
ncbi:PENTATRICOPEPTIDE REPEAT-CONTAINING PROTEIN [Salix purpurea]|uniref:PENTATRICOPEPTIDE REPEAT-CONTAINING PROTEIN n=1 Tax=Salix purpurea TaxID=77065 RepID=A0A9Q0YX72_SALPP|nr:PENTATRICOPEPTIDE REPEAT-CONTAINING PROTEIN [Salix purpurea]